MCMHMLVSFTKGEIVDLIIDCLFWKLKPMYANDLPCIGVQGRISAAVYDSLKTLFAT